MITPGPVVTGPYSKVAILAAAAGVKPPAGATAPVPTGLFKTGDE